MPQYRLQVAPFNSTRYGTGHRILPARTLQGRSSYEAEVPAKDMVKLRHMDSCSFQHQQCLHHQDQNGTSHRPTTSVYAAPSQMMQNADIYTAPRPLTSSIIYRLLTEETVTRHPEPPSSVSIPADKPLTPM
ncbi:unnamed protein product [Pleuronectes platessa]|uniref:Uncharacterized protein n=1 Tax=Pleuronectes platessa TaxID=8262 RepID=A0A9N7V761_PLEPL|nr:unnamed protein product [Pleuronectes platessa]